MKVCWIAHDKTFLLITVMKTLSRTIHLFTILRGLKGNIYTKGI